jgi:hypothetical protein
MFGQFRVLPIDQTISELTKSTTYRRCFSLENAEIAKGQLTCSEDKGVMTEVQKRKIEELIGKKWDGLTVVGYDEAAGKFDCDCSCGGSIKLFRHQITARKKTHCDECKSLHDYFRSIQINREELKGLNEELSARIVQLFVRHVRLSHSNGVQATSFHTFVTEIRAHPALADEEPLKTADERMESVLFRRYHQYMPPKGLDGANNAR